MSMAPPAAERQRKARGGTLAGFWRQRGFIQDYAEFLLNEINPALSLRHHSATVVAVVDETPDARTYVLRPNARWKAGSFTPGMHVQIDVEINGARLRRFYSISSSPQQLQREGTFSITVKRIAGGVMSNWLHARLRVGDRLRISGPQGEFRLGRARSRRVLLLAAGSGITPFMSMLSAHLPTSPEYDFTLLYYCCKPSDVIFAARLRELAARHPRLRLAVVCTDVDGLIDAEQLRRHCPDFTEREAFLCGPGGFMDAATELLTEGGISADRIYRESFGLRLDPAQLDAAEGGRVRFLASGREADAPRRAETILSLAEGAGLQPRHGCRSGVCHLCKCHKRSGRVLNLVTGQVSQPGEETIQICISVPQGEVEVDL